ncbi:MAG: hypothetical protein WCS99_17855, partial [Limisphaerales bacterium]
MKHMSGFCSSFTLRPLRRLLRSRVVLAVMLAVLALPRMTLAAGPRPNILVILVDDMGFSDIG